MYTQAVPPTLKCSDPVDRGSGTDCEALPQVVPRQQLYKFIHKKLFLSLQKVAFLTSHLGKDGREYTWFSGAKTATISRNRTDWNGPERTGTLHYFTEWIMERTVHIRYATCHITRKPE